MITNQHLRRMSKLELVQYAMEGDRQSRRAADELLRRYEKRFREKGLLSRRVELADPDTSAQTDDQVGSLL